ncbi:hypothetical protein PoB_004765300 [Plakobranchus ocellatus]|uniref:Uncharacterized protein n=1 Tax=Plakobranchus ocellatus TaxID=259542 RepID=A0AAV4BQS5_9GAST|nr:hypothetical protein PoB_004765300 [Plakobranchus ocellatus]
MDHYSLTLGICLTFTTYRYTGLPCICCPDFNLCASEYEQSGLLFHSHRTRDDLGHVSAVWLQGSYVYIAYAAAYTVSGVYVMMMMRAPHSHLNRASPSRGSGLWLHAG